jgi:hypothetical protein
LTRQPDPQPLAQPTVYETPTKPEKQATIKPYEPESEAGSETSEQSPKSVYKMNEVLANRDNYRRVVSVYQQ